MTTDLWTRAAWQGARQFPRFELESSHWPEPVPHPFPLHRDQSLSKLADGGKRGEEVESE